MVFIDFGLAIGNETLESWRLKSTKSISSDGFWLDEDRELELLNEEELEYEEQVVREDEDKRFELERRLNESSISVDSLMQSLVQASDDLLIFSLDKEE